MNFDRKRMKFIGIFVIIAENEITFSYKTYEIFDDKKRDEMNV